MAGSEKNIYESKQKKETVIQITNTQENVPALKVAPVAPPKQLQAPQRMNDTGSKLKEKIHLELDRLKNSRDNVFYFPDQAVLMEGYQSTFNETLTGYQRMQMSNVDQTSELFIKTQQSRKLKNSVKSTFRKRNAKMLSFMKERTIGCDEQTWNDLSFFINPESTIETETFLDRYLGFSVLDNGEIQGKDVNKALQSATYRLFDVDISDLHIETDKSLVENAARLEELSGMISAYDRLIAKHPDFMDSLEADERERITKHCDLLRAIAAYYVVRSALINDPYYQNHKREELSANAEEDSSPGQFNVANLLVQSFIMGNRLRREIGMEESPEPEGMFDSDFARKLLDNKDELTSKKAMSELIDTHVTARVNETTESIRQTTWYKKRLSMVFDVDTFLKIMKKDPLLSEISHSEEGIRISHDIQALHSFLSNEMPPIKLNRKGEPDKSEEDRAIEEINSSTVAITMLFNRLTGSIEAAERSYSGSPEIKRMFSELAKNCKKDSDLFKEKALEYRSYMIKDPGFRKPKATWNDALRYSRSVFYDLDSKDVTVKVNGAAASQVYAITPKKGAAANKTVYFRKEDKVPSENTAELIRDVVAQYDSIPEEKAEIIRGAIESLTSNKRNGQKLMTQINDLKEAKTKPVDIGKFFISSINELEELKNSAKDKDYEAYGHLFLDLADAWFKRNIAQWTSAPARIGFGHPLSQRNVATTRMATLLGISNLICDSRTAIIKQNGKLQQGNIMDSSEGVETSGKAVSKATYSDNAVSQLFTLSVFDMICGQVDRHFGNFHGILEKGVFKGIRGLDNDMSFGELRFRDISQGYNRLKRISDEKLIGLPAFFVNRVMALTPPLLQHVLGDILSKEELACLWDRIEGIKRSIINMTKMRTECKWNSKTNQIEFSGEDRDDTLRQLKALRILRLTNTDDSLEDETLFSSSIVNNMQLNTAIENRRNELAAIQEKELNTIKENDDEL